MTFASKSVVCWLLALSLTSSLAGTARAELDEADKQVVRYLANEAAKLFEQGQYDAAQVKFARAYEMARVPRLAVWLAKTHEKRGELSAAAELYRQAIALSPNQLWTGNSQQEAQKEAERALASLTPRLARLTVWIDGSAHDVAVNVDGVSLPSGALGTERFVEPGSRHVVAQRGAQRAERTLVLAAGSKQEVRLTLPPEPHPEAAVPLAAATTGPARAKSASSSQHALEHTDKKTPPLRTLGWVGVSAGAVGLVVGGVTGIVVGAQYSDLKDKCPGDSCTPEQTSSVNSYNSLRTISTVGFVAGGVLAAAGVTLLVTQRAEPNRPTVGLWVSPGMTGVHARF